MLLAFIMNTSIHLHCSIYPSMRILLLLFLILFILISFFFHQSRFIFRQLSVIILFQNIINFVSLRILVKFLTYQTLLFTIFFLNHYAFTLVHIYIFIILLLIQLIHHFLMSIHFLKNLFNLLKFFLCAPFAVPKYCRKFMVGFFADLSVPRTH